MSDVAAWFRPMTAAESAEFERNLEVQSERARRVFAWQARVLERETEAEELTLP